MSEQELKNTKLADHEMEQVQGGYTFFTIRDPGSGNERYYHFVGNEEKDRDRKYVCPICGRRLHYGKAWRYYCDDCNKSWFQEAHLAPNLNSGVWKQVDRSEYYDGYWGI